MYKDCNSQLQPTCDGQDIASCLQVNPKGHTSQHLATLKVLSPLEASRKMGHDLKEVPPRVCHMPQTLEMRDVMLANEAMKDNLARRNKPKT